MSASEPTNQDEQAKQSNTSQSDVLIIGAGLAGLMAAQQLQNQGRKITLVDKGRSVGGRMATRRMGDGRADHGAQFFTARSDEFKALVDQWQHQELVYVWSYGWASGSGAPVTEEGDGHPRYAVRDGMNTLTKIYGEQIEDVRVNVRITSIQQTDSGWLSVDENGHEYLSNALILTPPVPQSLALLDAGAVQLDAADRAALEKIQYSPCLAGLFRLNGDVNLPAPGAVQRPDAPMSWIANNRQKGISNETIITAHASGDVSEMLYNEPDGNVLNLMHAEFQYFLPYDAEIVEMQLKRWRYAQPKSIYPYACLVAKGLTSLVFAGDAFGGPRVEGAVLSGLASARSLNL
jgi:renalase